MGTKKLRVVIFGRPNVGKSTLFNQITGTRKAIVKDLAGVTRDVHFGKADWRGVSFEILDTAGVTEGGGKAWSRDIRKRALEAAEGADKILFVLDGKFGLNPEDRDLALFINRLAKPTLVIVNKIDQREQDDLALSEFFELDFESFLPASFEHKRGLDDILDWIVEGEERSDSESESTTLRLAVVGKPNAGKSTLVNSLLGESRVVVSPVAGTTVDSIEVPFTRDGQDYVLVDTAGLRRKAQRGDAVEKLSAFKSEESVFEADVLLLMVDAQVGPTHQDSRIVELALEQHRAVILVINKVDLQSRVPKFREKMREQIARCFHYYSDIPAVFISAKNKKGVPELFEKIKKVWDQMNFKIPTQEINEFFFRAIRQAPSPSFRGHDIKFYYVTQTRQRPPSFMAFVNEPRGISKAYKRFVISKIKEEYDLKGIPVRLYPKKRPRTLA